MLVTGTKSMVPRSPRLTSVRSASTTAPLRTKTPPRRTLCRQSSTSRAISAGTSGQVFTHQRARALIHVTSACWLS